MNRGPWVAVYTRSLVLSMLAAVLVVAGLASFGVPLMAACVAVAMVLGLLATYPLIPDISRVRRQRAQVAVLAALASHGELDTYQISRATRLRPGRLVVALADLEEAGQISSRWQNDSYPPRLRLYRYP